MFMQKGHNGNLPMKVQLSEDKIVSIEVDDSGESEGIANPVLNVYLKISSMDKR